MICYYAQYRTSHYSPVADVVFLGEEKKIKLIRGLKSQTNNKIPVIYLR